MNGKGGIVRYPPPPGGPAGGRFGGQFGVPGARFGGPGRFGGQNRGVNRSTPGPDPRPPDPPSLVFHTSIERLVHSTNSTSWSLIWDSPHSVPSVLTQSHSPGSHATNPHRARTDPELTIGVTIWVEFLISILIYLFIYSFFSFRISYIDFFSVAALGTMRSATSVLGIVVRAVINAASRLEGEISPDSVKIRQICHFLAKLGQFMTVCT
jgi:hypothetical protein